MTSIFSHELGAIFDNYADVIEGGNSYRGSGTAHRGIAGRYPNDRGLRTGDDTPLTVIGSTVSTTTFDVASTKSWEQHRWVTTKDPPFFAHCTTSGGAGNPNLSRLRKITGWDNTTKVFTVAAFPSAPIADDVMTILQGFKRLPNGLDIEDDDVEVMDHYDRTFHLSAKPGVQTRWYGDGLLHYKTDLELRIRMTKNRRLHDWTDAVFNNLMVIRSVLPRPELYESSFTKAMYLADGQEPEVLKEDSEKIVAVDRYTLEYKINATYL